VPKPILPEPKREDMSATYRTNHLPKGTCHERTVSRMTSRGQRLDEVSEFETCARLSKSSPTT